MIIGIRGRYLRFLEYKSSEFKKLCKLLTWEDEFAKSRGKSKIESILFEDQEGFYTFAGIIDLIEDEFKEIIIQEDDRKDVFQNIEVKDDILQGITLRDYQIMAVKKSVCMKRGLIEIPTAGGKTEISLGIYRTLYDQGLIKKALIVTPSIPIVKQFNVRALQRGLSANDIGLMYGKEKVFHKPLTFAVVNTLSQGLKTGDPKFIKLVKEADLIIFDEAHHAKAESFVSIARESESEYLIGMSGTPFKDRANILSDIGDATIYGLIGKIIFKVSQRSLVNKGYIADTVIFMKPVKGGFKKYQAHYSKIYSREIVQHRIRNDYIVDYINYFVACGLTVLISVNIKDHALELMKKLKKSYDNIRSICVFGGSEAHVYNENNWIEKYVLNHDTFVTDLESGVYDVIFATQVFDEGVDLPSVGALILGGGGKSLRQVRQRLGRGVRSKKTGKNLVFILDFFDRGHIYMFHQSNKRLRIYLDEVESDVLETEYEFMNLIRSCRKIDLNY